MRKFLERDIPQQGFSIEHVISVFETRDAYFRATHAGTELDLLMMTKGRCYGKIILTVNTTMW